MYKTHTVERTISTARAPIKAPSFTDVYATYIESMINNSSLNIISSSPLAVLSALMKVVDINVKLPLLSDPITTLALVKAVASRKRNTKFIVVTSCDRSDFKALKNIDNVLPMRYDDDIYECVKYETYDVILLMPVSNKGDFAKISRLAEQLSVNAEHLDLAEIDVIGVNFNAMQYKEEMRNYSAEKDGKIVVTDDNGNNNIIEIR